jgi:hypothetical protein
MNKLSHEQLNGKYCFIKLRLCVSRVATEKQTLLHRLWLCHDDFVNHDLCQESNCLMGEGFMGSEDFNSLDEFMATGALPAARCTRI